MSVFPPINPAMVAAFVEELVTIQPSQKPPSAHAALLAFLVELYWQGLPFPARQDVANHIACSVHSVDACLSKSLARSFIRPEVRTVTGNVKQRASTIRQTFYIPAVEILAIAAPFR